MELFRFNDHPLSLLDFLSYNQTSSSRQSYTSGSVTRLLQSSSSPSAMLDEYSDQQQIVYERSPNNSMSYAYETADGASTSAGTVLTEDMLFRSHANNGGKFPTHLLGRLGSQVYEIPAEQLDVSSNNSRRVTTTTTTRYYSVNPGEQGYEPAIDEVSASGEEKYVQIKASDLKDVLANYDVYSNQEDKADSEGANY